MIGGKFALFLWVFRSQRKEEPDSAESSSSTAA
jgi:hypothetical protein